MNEYKIYQVKREYLREYGFLSVYYHWDIPFTGGIPREIWELVYTYRTRKNLSLDRIYAIFNQKDDTPMPDDYTGRSLSVSDIVEDPDGVKWYCNSIGWRRVRWEEEAEE